MLNDISNGTKGEKTTVIVKEWIEGGGGMSKETEG